MNVSFLKVGYRVESSGTITLTENSHIVWGEIQKRSKNYYTVTIVMKSMKGNVMLKESFSAVYEIKNFFYTLQKKIFATKERCENNMLPGQIKFI